MRLNENYQEKSVYREGMKSWAPLALRGAGDGGGKYLIYKYVACRENVEEYILRKFICITSCFPIQTLRE